MTPSQMVERDRRARDEAGRKIHRPNGGPMVTTHPHGLLGEAYEECLDAINYLSNLPPDPRIDLAKSNVRFTAELLAAEIGDKG